MSLSSYIQACHSALLGSDAPADSFDVSLIPAKVDLCRRPLNDGNKRQQQIVLFLVPLSVVLGGT